MGLEADYLRRRANEERVAAMKAAHPKVREAHLELARLYDERLAAVSAGMPQPVQGLTTVA